MNLADKPCYSQRKLDSTGKPYGFITGLTFRERLIIALASNSALMRNDDWGLIPEGDFAKATISQADAIIAEMEK